MRLRREHSDSLVKPIPELNAFVFDGKYLCDNDVQEDISRRIDNNTEQLVNLDGLQRDRLHVTQALADAYPLIALVLDAIHGPDHGRVKILMLDFAYYVMQRRPFRTGHVVVPINQQQNDVRATNLVILPGTDRKEYRSTDVVPRDNIHLGISKYLPRSVTICKAGTAGMYSFKITADDGSRRMIGFAHVDAHEVYQTKVIPELVARNSLFHEQDVKYQDLCETYFVAFPPMAITFQVPDSLATTTDTPVPFATFHPRGKEQLELKKRAREVASAKASAIPEGMRECKTCTLTLSTNNYEGKRLECKGCRKISRHVHDNLIIHNPETATYPDACFECGIGFDRELFAPRGNGYRGTCRACINSKGYSEACRERQRENDLTGYLKRNAATHLEWSHKNPQAQKEQQLKGGTEPDRAFKVFLKQAEARSIDVDETCLDSLKIKLSTACHYCDLTPVVGDHLNGLDRVSSDVGYTDANTVSCCSTCNIMKGCHEMHEFVFIMRRIGEHNKLQVSDAPRQRLRGFGGWTELREALVKEKIDFLTKSQKLLLWSSRCYLCGRGPAFGIDREDSNKDYTEDNVHACCSDCNYAKKHLALKSFLEHVAHVCAHTNKWVLNDVMEAPLRTNTRAMRQAVCIKSDDGEILLVFPSISKAIGVTGGNDRTLGRAIQTKGKYCGYGWDYATPQMYRLQDRPIQFCIDVILSLYPKA